jgi:hypothetical protein
MHDAPGSARSRFADAESRRGVADRTQLATRATAVGLSNFSKLADDETEFFEGPGGETAQNRLGMEGYRDGIQQARDGMQETLPAGEIIHPDGVDG